MAAKPRKNQTVGGFQGGGRNGGYNAGDRGDYQSGGMPTNVHPVMNPAASAWVAAGQQALTEGLPATPAAPGATPAAPGMTADQQSAWAFMSQQLAAYGLGSLAPHLQWLIGTEGITDEASLTLRLQELPEWKTRFAGNEALRAAGLPVLSVGEYLQVERSYAQIMKNFGLPEGFYDDPSDFAGFIGNSVSASELQQRVTAWSDLANREDPAIKEQLRSMGIKDGDLIAYMMDPERAAPLIQKTYQQALVGGAARTQGLDASGASRLVELGITEREALQGYGVIAESMPSASRLSDIYGEDVDQSDLESEVFENNGEATRKRKRLASRERAAFQGTSGVGQGSLSRRDNGSY